MSQSRVCQASHRSPPISFMKFLIRDFGRLPDHLLTERERVVWLLQGSVTIQKLNFITRYSLKGHSHVYPHGTQCLSRYLSQTTVFALTDNRVRPYRRLCSPSRTTMLALMDNCVRPHERPCLPVQKAVFALANDCVCYHWRPCFPSWNTVFSLTKHRIFSHETPYLPSWTTEFALTTDRVRFHERPCLPSILINYSAVLYCTTNTLLYCTTD